MKHPLPPLPLRRFSQAHAQAAEAINRAAGQGGGYGFLPLQLAAPVLGGFGSGPITSSSFVPLPGYVVTFSVAHAANFLYVASIDGQQFTAGSANLGFSTDSTTVCDPNTSFANWTASLAAPVTSPLFSVIYL